jgi:hypothetical protein
MKQNAYARLVLLGLIVLGLSMVNFGKPVKDSGHKVAEQMLKEFNKRILLGSQIKAKLENSIVEPFGNGCYWVILKNLSITSDIFRAYMPLSKNVPEYFFPDVAEPIQVEELIFFYCPKKKDIRLLATKGMTFDLYYSESEAQHRPPKYKDFKVNKVHCTIGNMPHENREILKLIKSGKKDLPQTIQAALVPSDSIVENFKCEVSGMTKSKEHISILLEIERIAYPEGVKEDPYIRSYIFNRDAPPPDLLKTLLKGLAVVDMKLEVENIRVTMKKNGIEWGGGTISNLSYSLFTKPDKTRTFFNFCHSIDITGVELSIPGKKELTLLSDIKEFRYAFSMENLKSEAVLAAIDLFKKIIELRDMADASREQEVPLQTMRFFTEVMKSNPRVKYSISPLKHYFGELNAVVEINLKYLFAGPLVKITVNLFKVDDILRKLKEANMFSASSLKKIAETIEKDAVKTEDGNAVIIYELDTPQLQDYFFKNKSMMNLFK